MNEDAILQVKNVEVTYHGDEGPVRAVRDVSYEVFPDETLALVGESGCGKSQSSYGVMGLIQPPGEISAGEIWFRPEAGAAPLPLHTFGRNSKAMRSLRGGKMAMIFQEPMTAFSPVHKIGTALDEALRLHTDLDRPGRFARACEMLTRVGIPDAGKRYHQYSFEFSGGMRQRIMIALALCCSPRLLIADEPTTGLDVTIQAQILELIADLQREYHMGVVFITHDLAVVSEIADRVAVMYRGEMVEMAERVALFENPQHPYTRALLGSVVGGAPLVDGRLQVIQGSIPPPQAVIDGCAFHPRCDICEPGRCDREVPVLRTLGPGLVRCHLAGEGT